MNIENEEGDIRKIRADSLRQAALIAEAAQSPLAVELWNEACQRIQRLLAAEAAKIERCPRRQRERAVGAEGVGGPAEQGAAIDRGAACVGVAAVGQGDEAAAHAVVEQQCAGAGESAGPDRLTISDLPVPQECRAACKPLASMNQGWVGDRSGHGEGGVPRGI